MSATLSSLSRPGVERKGSNGADGQTAGSPPRERGALQEQDPLRLDTFDDQPDLSYDRTLWSDLTTLRFTEASTSVLILGPVGVGKTHLATALGHIAIRRRMTVGFHRADKLFTRLRAARLDNTLDAEIRRLTSIDMLIIDDSCEASHESSNAEREVMRSSSWQACFDVLW